MQEIVNAAGGQFTDLSATEATALVVRLLVAASLGALLGWERQQAGKSAGLRTHMLVAVGSAALVSIPLQSGYGSPDMSRVIQGLITGIGFLGAGCILKSEGHVIGLTTAAGIWLTAGVGVAAGLGREVSAILIAAVGWFTLSVLGRWESRWLSHHPRDNNSARKERSESGPA